MAEHFWQLGLVPEMLMHMSPDRGGADSLKNDYDRLVTQVWPTLLIGSVSDDFPAHRSSSHSNF